MTEDIYILLFLSPSMPHKDIFWCLRGSFNTQYFFSICCNMLNSSIVLLLFLVKDWPAVYLFLILSLFNEKIKLKCIYNFLSYKINMQLLIRLH